MTLHVLGTGRAVPRTALLQEQTLELARRACHDDSISDDLLRRFFLRAGVRKRHFVVLDNDPASRAVPGPGSEESQQSLDPNEPQCASLFPINRGEPDFGPTTGRRLALYEREALPLALAAARSALDNSGIEPRRITHLLTVSCSGFAAPGVDAGLIRELNLRPTVRRVHVGFMGCHGLFNALGAARAFVESDPEAAVLLCAVELCSLHFQYGGGADRMLANALFADGAAALVGVADHIAQGLPGEDSRIPGDSAAPCVSPGQARGYVLFADGSIVIPHTEHLMSWRIGDHGFEMSLAREVPEAIGSALRPWLVEWLAGRDRRLDQIGAWAVHPGGPRVLDAVQQALGLPAAALDASRHILAEYGNMSSATVLFILEELRRRNAPRPWLALAFGPGLTIEAALFA